MTTSGDDIGQQLIFQLSNTVAQREFFLFQALYLKWIGATGVLYRTDGHIQIPVFLPHAG